jgi:hypothetical protein
MRCKCIVCGSPCDCGELYCQEHLIEACKYYEEALKTQFREFLKESKNDIQRSGKPNKSRTSKQV